MTPLTSRIVSNHVMHDIMSAGHKSEAAILEKTAILKNEWDIINPVIPWYGKLLGKPASKSTNKPARLL